MRIAVLGDSLSARAIRTGLVARGYAVTVVHPTLRLYIDEGQNILPFIVVDGIDSPLEAAVVSGIAEFAPFGQVLLQRGGGVQDDEALRIDVPANDIHRVAVERGVVRGMLRLLPPAVTEAPPIVIPPEPWTRRLKRRFSTVSTITLALLLLAHPAAAQLQQSGGGGAVTQATSPWVVSFGTPQHLICDSGCGGASSFLDAAAFTGGTTPVNPFAGVFNDALADLVSGTAGAVRVSTYRSLHVELWSGNFEIGIPGNRLWIQGDVTVQPHDLTASGSLVDGAVAAPVGTENGLIVRNIPSGTQAVSGTFWQATQPVSGSLTVTQGTGTNLHIVCDSGCGGAASFLDNAAFTFGTTPIGNVGYVVDDAATNSVTENSSGAPRMTTSRIAYADLSKSASNTNSFKVDFGGAAQPVSGTFWQATQPVSAATLPLPTGASTLAEQQTQTTALQLIDNLPNTQGSATAGQSGALTLGAVTTAAPAYTTAQSSPLSLTLTGALRTDASATTQPVSGTVTTSPPANASTNVAQLAGTTTDTNSGLKSAGTLRVVLATDQPALTNKLLVTPDSVALPANQSVNVAQVAGTNTVTGGVAGILAVGGNVANAVAATANPVPVGGIFTTTPATLTTGQTATQQYTAAQNAKHDVTTIAGTAPTTAGKLDVKAADGDVFVRQATAANLNATVTPIALTKGTQGATGFSTQDLKDAGRNQTNYFMAAGIAGTNAEVMQSLTGYKGGAAVGATVTPAVVTTGKTYRVTSITLTYQSLASAGGCAFRLRANTAGAGVVTSPLVATYTIGSAAAVAGITTTEVIPVPDGMEFAAGTGIAVGMLGLSTVGAALAAGFGTITINGFEY